MTGAVAIFVKTPELSPVKTRLANAVGSAAAREFYEISCRAVREVVREVTEVAYWAVAEAPAKEHMSWHGFPLVYQGEGDLGTRLASVYETLRARHGAVVLIGADAPQITAEILRAALSASARSIVVGPARDGGFYLFGASQVIPSGIWESVPYSHRNTLNELKSALVERGPIEDLGMLTDVDEGDDLRLLSIELDALRRLTPAQAVMKRWLKERE